MRKTPESGVANKNPWKTPEWIKNAIISEKYHRKISQLYIKRLDKLIHRF